MSHNCHIYYKRSICVKQILDDNMEPQWEFVGLFKEGVFCPCVLKITFAYGSIFKAGSRELSARRRHNKHTAQGGCVPPAIPDSCGCTSCQPWYCCVPGGALSPPSGLRAWQLKLAVRRSWHKTCREKEPSQIMHINLRTLRQFVHIERYLR